MNPHWKVEKDGYHGTIDICSDDVVCVFWHLDEETHNRFEYEDAESNARLIVHRVNTYDKLVEALERISRYGEDGICPYGCDTPDIARQALQLAKEHD